MGAPQTRRPHRKPRIRKARAFVIDFTEVVDSPFFDSLIVEEAYPSSAGTMTLMELLLLTRDSKSQVVRRLDILLNPQLRLFENGPAIFISEADSDPQPRGGPRPPRGPPPEQRQPRVHLMPTPRVPKRY